MIPFFETRGDRFFASTSEDLSFPLHQHSHLELFFVLEGSAQVTVRKQTETLTAGTLAVIFPNQTHCYLALPKGGPCCRAALIICDPSLTGKYSAVLTGSHPARPFLPAHQLHPNVSYALQELLTEYKKEKGSKELSPVYGPLVQLVLARVLPGLSLHRNQRADSLDLTYQIVHFITENFREPLSLESLAKELGVSKYHLSHVFSEKMGKSFPEYLQSIRLGYALSLISDTQRSITDIAIDSGFESQRSFYRAFRGHYGCTPLQYRKENQL